MQSFSSLWFATVLVVCSSQANATADFGCEGRTLNGNVHVGAMVHFDHATQKWEHGSLRVTVDGKEIDMSDVETSTKNGWTVLERGRKKHFVIAFRRADKNPDFLNGKSDENAGGWNAELKYPLSTGQLKIVKAACLIG